MNDSIPPKSILLLAANPKDSKSLRLQEEEREISDSLRSYGYGKTPIKTRVATRTRDILKAMLDFEPQIVHFSGHGSGQDGLVFEDAIGQGKLVRSEALAKLFQLFSNSVECVVLNACYSRFQAEAIAEYVPYVVGMSNAVGDRAAIEFAAGFYMALGAGYSIDFAYASGCVAIQIEDIPEHLTPILYEKGEIVYPYPDRDEPPQVKPREHREYNDLEQVWLEVIGQLPFRGAEVLLQQQACLLAFDGREARVGIKSQPLFQMAKKQLTKIEDAFEAVYRRKVQVVLEVTTISAPIFLADKDDLSSERFGADYYTKLQNLLKAGQWKEADKETADCMCAVMDRQKEGWLNSEHILNFPCQDLRNIDRLWVKYSQGKFGFSIQKKIYLEYKARLTRSNSDGHIWNEFGNRVGWRINERWISSNHLNFDISAPAGQLPGGLMVPLAGNCFMHLMFMVCLHSLLSRTDL